MKRDRSTLPEPQKPTHLPSSVQWLAGEGAGSWFYLEPDLVGQQIRMQRFSPEGTLECEGFFKPTADCPDLQRSLKVTHLSHCQQLSIEQDGSLFLLQRV